MHRALVDRGALEPVDVDGLRGRRFCLAAEATILRAPPEPIPAAAFIAPFDPLLWDKSLLANLFDFDYGWEGFFPPARRRWGYYVLPILFGDRFVGRIEPRIHRDRHLVDVLNVWWEDGFLPRGAEGFVGAMHSALQAYLDFAGADRLERAPYLMSEERLLHPR